MSTVRGAPARAAGLRPCSRSMALHARQQPGSASSVVSDLDGGVVEVVRQGGADPGARSFHSEEGGPR
jgi:methylphosphotriester-DNA--protein-cysteine methyltransferase